MPFAHTLPSGTPSRPPRPRQYVYCWLVTGLCTMGAVLSACTATIGPGRQDTGTAVTAFVDVAVVPMDRERVLTGQTVLVQGNRITALGSVDRVHVPLGAQRIDGRGKFLLPGLADMHTHIAHTRDSTQAKHALLFLLAHGVTTIRNMDYDPDDAPAIQCMLRFRSRAAAGTLLSPHIYTAGPWGPKRYTDRKLSAKESQQTLDVSRADIKDSVAAYVAAYKAAGYDFIKIHEESRPMTDAVAAAAHRVGIPIVGHMPDGGNYGYPYALAVGYKSIEHLSAYGLEDVGIPADKRDPRVLDTMHIPALTAAAEATRRAGVWNCPTQAVEEWLWLNFHNDTRVHGGGLPLRRRTIQALQAAGAGLLAGTDAIWVPLSFEPLLHLTLPMLMVQDEFAALVRAGLTPYQALATGTRNVAAYFGTLSESGTVAVRKRADLVLLDGDPLADIQNTRRIAGVMRDGHWLARAELDRRLAAITDLPAYSPWEPPH